LSIVKRVRCHESALENNRDNLRQIPETDEHCSDCFYALSSRDIDALLVFDDNSEITSIRKGEVSYPLTINMDGRMINLVCSYKI